MLFFAYEFDCFADSLFRIASEEFENFRFRETLFHHFIKRRFLQKISLIFLSHPESRINSRFDGMLAQDAGAKAMNGPDISVLKFAARFLKSRFAKTVCNAD